MSAEKRWRLICYDVRDPKRYRELYKVMRGVGRRIQYSVFRSRLDDRQIEELRWKLAKILDPVDRLLVVDLCPTCASRAISRNHVEGWTEKPAPFTIVSSQAHAGVETTAAPTGGKEGDSEGIGGRRGEGGS
jgi:CRISPR-associated protein Cas2